jgi:hypothetical protein
VGRHLGSLGIGLIDMLVVVVNLRSLQLLGVGCPIDEKGLIVLGLVLDVSRDLLNRLGLKSFLSVGTQFAGDAFNRLTSLAFAPNLPLSEFT